MSSGNDLLGNLDELLASVKAERRRTEASETPALEESYRTLLGLCARLLGSIDAGERRIDELILEIGCRLSGAPAAVLYRAEWLDSLTPDALVRVAVRGDKDKLHSSTPYCLDPVEATMLLQGAGRRTALAMYDPAFPPDRPVERRRSQPTRRLLGLIRWMDPEGRPIEAQGEAAAVIAELGAAALRGERLYREASTDTLTGLYSRRHFESLLRREVEHARNTEAQLSLVMLDIDRFKPLNDRYGHPAGDSVLRALGETLRTTVRQEDFAARYGGEEFAVILPGTSASGAAVAAEKIRDRVQRVQVPRDCPALTMSLGVAELRAGSQTAEELVSCADRALYQAKLQGRNRVVVFDPALLDAPRGDELAGVLTGDAARDHRNVSLLLRVNRALSSAGSIDDLLAVIVDAALEITDAERGIILLLDEPQSALRNAIRSGVPARTAGGPAHEPAAPRTSLPSGGYRYRVARGRGGRPLPWVDGFSRSIPRKVLAGGGPVCFELIEGQGDAPESDVPVSVQDLHLRRVFCAPLQAGGTMLGALYVDSHAGTDRFSAADFAFFQALASHAASVIHQASLLEQLEESHRELQDLERAKSDFITVASHELKTPLTSVLGYTALLRRRPADQFPADVRRALDVIDRESTRLAERVQDILSLTRVGMDQIPLKRTHFGIRQLIGEVLADVRPFAEARRFELVWDAETPDRTLWAEREAIRAVLQNLLQNAVRFTPDGGRVEVRLKDLQDPDAGPVLRVLVQDNGIGIAPENRAQIFERFRVLEDTRYHVSGTYEFRAGGMGIGLAIARGIVQAHGGRIGFDSEVGRGSTFWFDLPLPAEAGTVGSSGD